MRSLAPQALARYREAAAGWFLAKADAELPDIELESLPRMKRDLAASIGGQLTETLSDLLDESPTLELLADRGTFHAVFRVGCFSGELYARTSVPEVPWPALDFAVEAWASRTLGALGVPVPKVRHLDLSRERLPVDLEVLDGVPGRALPAGPGAAGAARSLGSLLARLHAVGCEGAGPLDPASLERPKPSGLHPAWRDYVTLRLDEHLELCRSREALTGDEAAFIEEALERCAPLIDSSPTALLHGDLANQNLLVDEERVKGLLDWEDALAGDPVFDLAGWGTFVGNHERRDALLEGYLSESGSSGLPHDFELRYWLYFLRIMLAKTVHRHRFGYSRTDRIPARERLRPAMTALAELLGEAG